MLREDHDPALDVFDGGCLVLRRDGEVVGHVATTLGTFWSPFRPLTRQQWVWFVVVWADGEKEPPFEDYPPFTAVAEVIDGRFEWEDGPHQGVYDAVWLSADEGRAKRAELGITSSDF